MRGQHRFETFAAAAMLAILAAACGSRSSNQVTPSTCGNGVIEAGETCDPPGSCPTTCDDGNACTRDTTTGSVESCNLACGHVVIATCTSGDGCCPADCTAKTDSDCSSTCGNGVIEPGETCDPPGSCPSSCSDGNACTIDGSTGSAANCNLSCTHQAISACANGDACCPAGCNTKTDSDCSPACGNGVIEPGETCDPPGSCPSSCSDGNACTIDGSTGSAANCNLSCTHQAISACANGDACCPAGCNANTDSDCSPTCGNGAIEVGETCDPPGSCPSSCDDGNACTIDGSTGSAANCNLSCTHQAISACEDGDGCCPAGCNANTDSDCPPTCGNGVIEAGETCDPPDSCPSSCSDGDACTTDGSTGSAASCDLRCTHQAINACVNGDGCCPAGCNGSTDSDCACCVLARPMFLKLAEGTLTTGALASDPIRVAGYTEIVVYVSASRAGTGACPTLDPPQFRSDPALPFATTGRRIDVAGGRLLVDGSELRLSMGNPALFPSCTSVSYHYVVAGVQ